VPERLPASQLSRLLRSADPYTRIRYTRQLADTHGVNALSVLEALATPTRTRGSVGDGPGLHRRGCPTTCSGSSRSCATRSPAWSPTPSKPPPLSTPSRRSVGRRPFSAAPTTGSGERDPGLRGPGPEAGAREPDAMIARDEPWMQRERGLGARRLPAPLAALPARRLAARVADPRLRSRLEPSRVDRGPPLDEDAVSPQRTTARRIVLPPGWLESVRARRAGPWAPPSPGPRRGHPGGGCPARPLASGRSPESGRLSRRRRPPAAPAPPARGRPGPRSFGRAGRGRDRRPAADEADGPPSLLLKLREDLGSATRRFVGAPSSPWRVP